MRATSLSHLSSVQLVGKTRALVASDHANLADLIWHLAEIDARQLYLEKAHPSMLEFCLEELGMTEDVALKRISVARVAREHPRVMDYLADGRLNISAVLLLRPYLGAANPAELFEAAARKTRDQIEHLLAQRFPKTELLQLIEAIPADAEQAVANGAPVSAGAIFSSDVAPSACAVASLAPGRVTSPRTDIRPVAPERFALHLTMGRSMRDKIEYAKRLFSHQVPSGDVAELMERAFELLIAEGEKTKFGATEKPQTKERPTTSRRHVPSRVKRAVWRRDGGQCTFVSADGRRCGSLTNLEYDHATPVAHGGQATVENIRLRCRGHNQYDADHTFGSGFMEMKREQARSGRMANSDPIREETPSLITQRVARNAELACAAAAEAEAKARVAAAIDEIVPWLCALGIRAQDAKRAAATCADMTDIPIEERVKRALQCFGRPTRPR